ncbi:MAG: glutamate racemase, partial [Bacteroidia bacterium]
EQTQSGVVGVLATTATFQGELFASVVERFAKDVLVLRQPCPGLVQQIEAGKTNDPETETMLRAWVEPMLEKGIDALVLGCTHYPFIRPLLQKIVGDGVRLIDPAPAVARQTRRLLDQQNLLHPEIGAGSLRYFTTELANDFEQTLFLLTGEQREVERVVWERDLILRENL